ncbi:MAG: BamA/TamA family outer membrane protein [Bryobacteraceae bacterium]
MTREFWRIGTVFLLVAFAAGALLAEAEDYEGRTIQAVEFTPAAQPYSRDYLDRILPIHVNEPLHLAAIRAAIERLYATGRYKSIAVDATPSEGGVAIRFLTAPEYFVGRVTVEKVSEPPGEGVLVNATRLELGAPYTEEAGKQAVANIQDVLRSNGYWVTQVTPHFEFDSTTQSVAIHFSVDSGERARYQTPVAMGDIERPITEILKSAHWKGWLGWKSVTDARTEDGVRRVRRSYLKGGHLEARVALAKSEYDPDENRVAPVLDIEGGPKIQVAVTGVPLSTGKLRQLIPIYEEQSVDRDLLVEGANNIQEYMESRGYFHSRVEFSTKMQDPDTERIEYTIARGDFYRVALVAIEGNAYFDTNTLRERMYIHMASPLQFRHGRFSDRYLRHDLDAIESLYRANGFRDVAATSRVEQGYRHRENDIAVYLRIAEGPQWLVEKLDLEGPAAEDRTAIERLLQSRAGQPFSDNNVGVDRDNVLEYYYDSGYPDASFEWTFQPGTKPHRVDLIYTVVPGPRKFVRGVLISGLGGTNRRLVEQRIELQPGDPLSRASMLDTERRLYDLGVFARVDMALQDPEGDEPGKYVLLDVDEAHKYTLTTGFGAEFGRIGGCSTCLDAPAGTTGFSPRASFGVTRRDLFGEGHIVSLQSMVSSLEQRAVASYEAPQFRGNSKMNLLFSTVFDDSKDVRTFSATREEASVQLGQKVSRASTLLYRFTYRDVNVDPATLKISPELIPLLSQPVRIGIAGVSYVEDRRDDALDSHRGIYNTIDLGWATHSFGSQSDFTRVLAHNATYYPFGLGSRFVLARATTFGWIQNLRSGTQIPLAERFFSGGADSGRAFPENQAGPRDLETGFPLGGSALFMNQVELRHPLPWANVRGVLFWDAGNIYSGLDAISLRTSQHGLQDFNYMVHAVGFGLRYRTPVGPIRLDLAYSINPPTFYGYQGTLNQLLFGTGMQTIQQISHFQFHFSLGQAF